MRVKDELTKDALAIVFVVAVGVAIHRWLPDGYLGLWGIAVLLGWVVITDCMPTWPFRKRAGRREL